MSITSAFRGLFPVLDIFFPDFFYAPGSGIRRPVEGLFRVKAMFPVMCPSMEEVMRYANASKLFEWLNSPPTSGPAANPGWGSRRRGWRGPRCDLTVSARWRQMPQGEKERLQARGLYHG